MSDYEIRTDLSMPDRRPGQRAHARAFPLDVLEVGQCILVDATDEKKAKALSNAASNFKRTHPGWGYRGYTIVDRDGKRKYGVWCTQRADRVRAQATSAEPAPSRLMQEALAATPRTKDHLIETVAAAHAAGNGSQKLREIAKLQKPGVRTVMRK